MAPNISLESRRSTSARLTSDVRPHTPHRFILRAVEANAFLRMLRPYSEAFIETDLKRRSALLEAAMTPDAQIYGPKRLFAGYGEISEKITGFQKNWPNCRLVLASGLNVFHDAARFACAIVDANGVTRAQGEAVVELAEDGRICRVLPYWETLPPLPADWPAKFAVGHADSAA